MDFRIEVRQLVEKVATLEEETDSLRKRADVATRRLKSCERRLAMLEDENPIAMAWAAGTMFHVPAKPPRLKILQEN